MRAQDLTGEAKELYEEWRSLGYTERQALDRVERSGLVRESQLYDTFRDVFGLSREAASAAALGRDPEAPADDHERLVGHFRSLGLSEQAAEVAAGGRDPAPRPVSDSEARSSWLQPGDNQRLITLIEQWASDLLVRGPLCVERGETREQAALKEAFGKVFLNAQNDLQRLWITTVVRSWRPELLAESGSGSSGQSSQRSASESKPAGGKQRAGRSVEVAEFVTRPRESTNRVGRR